jgi:hypothetical protein
MARECGTDKSDQEFHSGTRTYSSGAREEAWKTASMDGAGEEERQATGEQNKAKNGN